MDVVSAITTALVTVAVIGAAALAAGFAVLVRRRSRTVAPVSSDRSIGGLSRRAGSLLVKVDDALREADDELGFALAQFGAAAAQPYADALAEARATVGEAFQLKQALDDAHPESEQQKRSMTLQVITLCEQAAATLERQDSRFTELRALEVNASGTLADVRSRIAASTGRLDAARATIAELSQQYDATTFAQISQNPADAEKALAEAAASADAAAPGISQAGVSAVSGTLEQAARSAQHADQLLDAVDRTARDLSASAAALATLREETAADLVEARRERDAAPDADTGAAIIQAIVGVESALAAGAASRNPVADLDTLGDAISALDLALASARNQTQRLAHARAAYAGTLVSVTSQLAAAHDYISRYGGGVEARTRLSEAERQLTIAKAEADPVAALDAVRRSVTLARDADALARYDTMGSRS